MERYDEYYELPDDERLKLLDVIKQINKSYKEYCNIINKNKQFETVNQNEIDLLESTTQRIIVHNIDKLAYNGFKFLIRQMGKVQNTDIQYPIDFLNIYFNCKFYIAMTNGMITSKEKNEPIEPSKKKYYFYFIYIELVKYNWLNNNYQPSDVLFEDGFNDMTSQQVDYEIYINNYINEEIQKIKRIIITLYDDIKTCFPEWETEISLCKDIIFTMGNPINLYYDGSDYVIKS